MMTPASDLRLPFGKHQGKRLDQVPRHYLQWLLGADGLAYELRDVAL